MSNVRGDVETVLDTFPGLHFPVTRSTAGADGSCRLSDRAVLLVAAACHAAGRPVECLFLWTTPESLCPIKLSRSVSTSSDLHKIVTDKSPHFLTSSDSSFEDEVSASKLKYTDEHDVWSIEQRESSPPRGSIWHGAGAYRHAGDTWHQHFRPLVSGDCPRWKIFSQIRRFDS